MMWKMQLMKDLVAEGSELMPHRTKRNLCDNIKSEPNNGRTTRTARKTISRNLDVEFEEEMKPDVSQEIGSNGCNKRKR